MPVLWVCAAHAAEPASVPSVDEIVSIRDAAGRTWCATVVSVGKGVDAETWVWVRYNADGRRIDRVPVKELASGCEPPPLAGQGPTRRATAPVRAVVVPVAGP